MDNYSVDTIEYKGYKIAINYDEDTEDPTTWTTPEERGATFALHHNRYTLPFELENKYDDEGNNLVDLDLYNSWEEFAKACAPEDQQNYRFVRWYEHSGIAVSLRDDESGHDWDAGIAGVIFGETTDTINAVFEDWRSYIQGEVYYFCIYDQDGELVDSLSGIYGLEYAEQEAKDWIDAYTPPHKVAKKAQELHA